MEGVRNVKQTVFGWDGVLHNVGAVDLGTVGTVDPRNPVTVGTRRIAQAVITPGVPGVTALASAARTALTDSPTFYNPGCRGIFIWLVITVASGTGGLTVKVLVRDPVSGSPPAAFTAGAAILAVGTYAYELCPGASTPGTAGTLLVNTRVAGSLPPERFIIEIGVGDASSYTYSVGAMLLN
jgi:hypothetical protein